MHRGAVRLQRIERACSCQIFKAAPIYLAGVNTIGEIIEAFEKPCRCSLRHKHFHGTFADILYAAQCISDGMFAMGIRLNRKFGFALVNVGRMAHDL